jgi:CheY-like chemotaxis protein
MPQFNKVLLVDDDKASNFLSGEILGDMNIANEIDVAEDGDIATERIGQGYCPDLIFLDLRMPRMDGFDFLETFTKSAACKDTRVIILTSSPRTEDRERALQYDVVLGYIEKPLTEQKVLNLSAEFDS